MPQLKKGEFCVKLNVSTLFYSYNVPLSTIKCIYMYYNVTIYNNKLRKNNLLYSSCSLKKYYFIFQLFLQTDKNIFVQSDLHQSPSLNCFLYLTTIAIRDYIASRMNRNTELMNSGIKLLGIISIVFCFPRYFSL